MALACYLMSSPHSNMIGIYDLPVEYIAYDTGLAEIAIRDALALLERALFAFYDAQATTIYIPSFAEIQIAPELNLKDKRLPAIQREFTRSPHTHFRKLFFERYGEKYHLSPIEGASKPLGSPSEGGSKGHPSPIEGAPEALLSTAKGLLPVDNQGASKGHRRGFVPDPVSVETDKRGLGGEGEEKPHRRGCGPKAFFEDWPARMANKT